MKHKNKAPSITFFFKTLDMRIKIKLFKSYCSSIMVVSLGRQKMKLFKTFVVRGEQLSGQF